MVGTVQLLVELNWVIHSQLNSELALLPVNTSSDTPNLHSLTICHWNWIELELNWFPTEFFLHIIKPALAYSSSVHNWPQKVFVTDITLNWFPPFHYTDSNFLLNTYCKSNWPNKDFSAKSPARHLQSCTFGLLISISFDLWPIFGTALHSTWFLMEDPRLKLEVKMKFFLPV